MSDGPGGWGLVAELRQGLYRFFAGSLLAPDEERLASVVAAAELLAGMGVDDFAFAGAWHRLEDALAELPAADRLATEYVRLFVAGGDGPLCPPTESHHLPPGGAGAGAGAGGGGAAGGGCGGPGGGPGETHASLRRDYAGMGLAVAEGTPYGPDHVATELEAMATLCHEEAHAWEEGSEVGAVSALRRQWTFLDGHLAAWLPRLAAEVDAAATGFYPALLAAADAFVRHDHELVTTLARAHVAGLRS